jgi:hypothetical protein
LSGRRLEKTACSGKLFKRVSSALQIEDTTKIGRAHMYLCVLSVVAAIDILAAIKFGSLDPRQGEPEIDFRRTPRKMLRR